MSEVYQKSKQVWEENLKKFPHTRLQFPSQELVRLFSGKYISLPQPPGEVLDHGFGHGNNLKYFLEKGYTCSGCEISQHLISEAQNLFKSIGKTVNLRLIKDASLPFENDHFNIVVSWNSIHYNASKDMTLKVIDELHRVLKPGGVLLLSTLHPDSSMFDRLEKKGNGEYIIKQESSFDNREGLQLFLADSESDLKALFSIFSDVRVGETSFNLFNHALRESWFLVHAVKRA